MENNQELFDAKVISKDKVYLFASDCAKALKYETKEAFLEENPGVSKTINGIPELISEGDYNRILVSRPEAFKDRKHIEFTKINSLSAEVSSFRDSYAFKTLFCGDSYERIAKEKGCSSISEYIEEYEIPQNGKRLFDELKNMGINLENYAEQVRFVQDKRIFVPDIMEQNGMTLQFISVIGKNGVSLYPFIAGDGFFYQVHPDPAVCEEIYLDENGGWVDSKSDAAKVEYLYGEELYAQVSVNDKGELCIPIYAKDTVKKVGKTVKSRNFSKYNVFENVVWALQNSEYSSESYGDAFYSAPGIDMSFEEGDLIAIAVGNTSDLIAVEGIVECDLDIKTTKVKNHSIFAEDFDC